MVPQTKGRQPSLSAKYAKSMKLGTDSPDHTVALASVLPMIVVVHGSDNHLFVSLHNVWWASRAKWSVVQGLGIEHGGAYSLMAQ